jgi:hypothetical protein
MVFAHLSEGWWWQAVKQLTASDALLNNLQRENAELKRAQSARQTYLSRYLSSN